jgi:hypothetical protein
VSVKGDISLSYAMAAEALVPLLYAPDYQREAGDRQPLLAVREPSLAEQYIAQYSAALDELMVAFTRHSAEPQMGRRGRYADDDEEEEADDFDDDGDDDFDDDFDDDLEDDFEDDDDFDDEDDDFDDEEDAY